VNVVGYSYPWDYVGDPGAVQRALALGVDVVALAASYHACRAVSPLHPTRRVMEVSHSALYVPVREEAWRGQRLAPITPEGSGDDDLFNDAREQLVEAGLGVDAWIVLTHHDELGRENPELAVKNAFGDVYTYALCPQAPDVRQYCLTLSKRSCVLDRAVGWCSKPVVQWASITAACTTRPSSRSGAMLRKNCCRCASVTTVAGVSTSSVWMSTNWRGAFGWA